MNYWILLRCDATYVSIAVSNRSAWNECRAGATLPVKEFRLFARVRIRPFFFFLHTKILCSTIVVRKEYPMLVLNN